jgi:hypothetical protein
MLTMMLIPAAHIDVTTVLLSAGISAAVAAFVSWLFNFILGGWMEVRKQRALERESVRRALEESIRFQLNAVQAFGPGVTGWICEGGKVVAFDDAFDTNYEEMLASYQPIRRHVVGMGSVEPEYSVGRVVRIAGAYVERVYKFRDEAISNPPEPLETHRVDIRDDMESALALLQQMRDVLWVRFPRRRYRRSRLSKRLDQLEKLGASRREPKTPMSYPRTDGRTVESCTRSRTRRTLADTFICTRASVTADAFC